MSESRIALYIGNSLYPNSSPDPAETIATLQNSPLTSPILSLLNEDAGNPSQLVYNDGSNPVFNIDGDYIGSDEWAPIISELRSGGSIREVYLSFSTSGTAWMSDLIGNHPTAANKIFDYIKNTLGFDGIDLDDESGKYKPGDPIYVVAHAAAAQGLKITAAPYWDKQAWNAWVDAVQSNGGTVAWLNLQCYAGGKTNNPGAWMDIGVPIVAGSCNSCGLPQTTCSPSEVEALFTLWRTGQGTVSPACWNGIANTAPQAIGGGFIWVYSSIEGPQFMPYMDAMQAGLGM